MRCADKGEKAAGTDICDYIYTLNGIFAAYPFMFATLAALAQAFNEAPTRRHASLRESLLPCAPHCR